MLYNQNNLSFSTFILTITVAFKILLSEILIKNLNLVVYTRVYEVLLLQI